MYSLLKRNVEAWLLIYLMEGSLRLSSGFSAHTAFDLCHLSLSLNDPVQLRCGLRLIMCKWYVYPQHTE